MLSLRIAVGIFLLLCAEPEPNVLKAAFARRGKLRDRGGVACKQLA